MFLFTAPRPRFYYAFRQVPRAASVSTTLFLAVQIRNRTTAMNTQDKPKNIQGVEGNHGTTLRTSVD
jgi:hypothetical protein